MRKTGLSVLLAGFLAGFLTEVGSAICDPTLLPSYTTRMGLEVPQINSCIWGIATNNNWAILDSSAPCLSCTNTWTGTNNYNAPFTVIDPASGSGISGLVIKEQVAGPFKPNLQFQGTSGGLMAYLAYSNSGTTGLTFGGGDDGLSNPPIHFDLGFGGGGATKNAYFSYGVLAGSLTATNLTSGQCVQAGTGGLLTVSGSACGGGGSFTLPASIAYTTSTVAFTQPQTVIASVTVNGNLGVTGQVNQSLTASSSVTLQGLVAIPSSINTQLTANSSATVLGNLGVKGQINQSLTVASSVTFSGGNQVQFSSNVVTPGATFYSGGNVVVGALTASRCVQTDANGNLSSAGATCGSGGTGSLIYPATSTPSFPFGVTGTSASFTGPLQSTFTYGLTVGSMTVNGPGNGQITLTISGSTYTVTSTSGGITVGQLAVFTSTNGTIANGGYGGSGGGGTPGGNNRDVQINNAGVLGGDTNFILTPTSMTYQNRSVFNYQPGDDLSLDNAQDGMIIMSRSTSDRFNLQMTGTGNDAQIHFTDPSGYPKNLRIAYQGGVGTDFFTNNITKDVSINAPATNNSQRILFGVGSSSATLMIDSNTHVNFEGTSPPTIASCGTSPIPDALCRDQACTITPGATASGCGIIFAHPFLNTPTCTVSERTMSLVNALSYVVTKSSVTVSQTSFTSIIDVLCAGKD